MCMVYKRCLLVFFAITNVYLLAMGAGSIVVGVSIERLADDQKTYIIYMTRFPSDKSEDAKDTVEKESIFEKAGLIFLISGAVLIGFGLVGTLVIILRRRTLIIAYMILLFLSLICEITVTVLGFIFINNIDYGLSMFLLYTLKTQYTGAYIDIKVEFGTLNKEIQTLLEETPNIQGNSSIINEEHNNDVAEKLIFESESFVLPYFQEYLENATAVTTMEKISLAWDRTMLWLECCGNDNYSDFLTSSENWHDRIFFTIVGMESTKLLPFSLKMKVPPSCCIQRGGSNPPIATFEDLPMCLTTASPKSTEYDSCYDKIKNYLELLVHALTFLALALAIAEIFALVNACLLWRAFKAEEQDELFEVYGPAQVATQHNQTVQFENPANASLPKANKK